MTDLLVCRLERCYCQPAGLASCRRRTTVVAPRSWHDGRGTAVLAVPGNRCERNARAPPHCTGGTPVPTSLTIDDGF